VTENSVYSGHVRHRRSHIKSHAFTYSLFMFYVDITELANTFKTLRWCSFEKYNWFSFRRKNYFGDQSLPLDQAVRNFIAEKTGNRPDGKIFLLTQLATLGYSFNPISVYIVYKLNSDIIEMLLTEVTNTPWGVRHVYILDKPDKIKNAVHQYTFKKTLHVSPFMEMDYTYKLNFKIDEKQLILHMDSFKNNEHHFDATLSLQRQDLNNKTMAAFMLRYPFMTFKTTLLIYWEALKLFLKKVPFHSYPKSGGL
jgi:DUF1365 family protein